MAHIVVVGSGIGGIPAAYELKDVIGSGDKITVINNRPYFQFTPSNPWAAVGWRKREDITIDMGPVFARKGIDFIPSAVTAMDPENNTLTLENGDTVTYDYLVIAAGPELAFDEIEGLGPEGGHTQSVCTIDHAEKAYTEWEKFCADPGPIVVGAVQLASCFGPAYEFAAIMDTDLKKRGIRDKVPMTFVTSEPYIGHLGLGGVGDTKGMLESEFRDRSIRWITNARVDKVEAGKMFVTEHDEDGNEKRTHELDFKFSMMLPAFRGVRPAFGIEGLANPRGFIIVDEHQRNPKYPNIYAVGVCIAIPPLEATPVPVGVPKTGYMIESMVAATVQNIGEELKGGQPTHKPTWNALCLADLGNTGMVFMARPQNPPRNVNWSASGKWVHLAKVAFEKYFLGKVRRGSSEPFIEKYLLGLLKMHRLK
ncbi:MAG TPA: NAD(P)/FAD-dependent oxidoreductase [Thermopetrobacter sp.]|nr:NAD(P)/FAD-dependent oxidoreductase [Thermopetrobacter sp.]